jgi:hypothetical protein
MVDVANLGSGATLVDRNDGSAPTATGVVDLVVSAFHRYEVYRVAAVDDGEVGQHTNSP